MYFKCESKFKYDAKCDELILTGKMLKKSGKVLGFVSIRTKTYIFRILQINVLDNTKTLWAIALPFKFEIDDRIQAVKYVYDVRFWEPVKLQNAVYKLYLLRKWYPSKIQSRGLYRTIL